MGNTIGTIYRYTIWGQSHAAAIGVTIEGIPAGSRINLDKLQHFLDRRKPGQGPHTTSRREGDRPEFIAGVTALPEERNAGPAAELPEKQNAGAAAALPEERIVSACGSPVTAVIRNTDTRSSDYDELRYIPRPGHADFAAMVRYGEARDSAGGGQFSGRMTAPLCIAGGIALQFLKERGITIAARPIRIGGETDPEKMRQVIEKVRAEGDSVGGIVECVIEGVPAGIGEPMFDGIENRIAQAVFGIPAVKGIEFGSGFQGADLRGSENNDPFCLADPAPSGACPPQEILSRVRTASNHHGGALGGISSGMPIVFRTAFKPTPSIAAEQDSVDVRTGEAVKLRVKGRHDPCIVPRAVPVVEAAAAAALYDLIRIREA